MNLFYRKLIRPIIFRLEAENAHNLACRFLSFTEKYKVPRSLIKYFSKEHSCPVNLFGLSFPNQIGLAAGMDKNAEFPNSFSAFGFGHLEVGTITPEGQTGNPQPRLFRYPQYNAIVNRMGFNNLGVEKISTNIQRNFPKHKRTIPLGINIGKGKNTSINNAIEDYRICLKKVVTLADYVTINISSPNTPNLRKLHHSDFIIPFLKELSNLNTELAKQHQQAPVPLLLKISPDESFRTLELIVLNAVELGFSGIIATNTSISRFSNKGYKDFETGGLSGNPIESKSLSIVKFLAKVTDHKFPIIGVGGISCLDSALRKLDAGASLIQIYSSFVYNGPFFPSTLSKAIRYRNKSWP